MSAPSDELMSAYLDDEVDAADRASIESALREDPDLALRALRMRRNDLALRQAVDTALGPPPAALLAVLAAPESPSNVVPLRPRPSRLRRGGAWAMPIAASLAVGLMVGRVTLPSPAPAFMATSGSGMVAGPQLADALSGAKSGVPQKLVGGTLQVALSFQARNGAFCRQFDAKIGADTGAGVACRANQGWEVENWTRGGPAPGAGYETAGGPDDPATAAALSRLGVARVLDRAAEDRAIAQGWAPSTPPPKQ